MGNETLMILDNSYPTYKRKHFMFLRLQELVHQNKYDHEKALKMFKLITDDVGREHKIPIEDRRQADVILRQDFERGEWKEEAKSLYPDRYKRVFGGWHTVFFTLAVPQNKPARAKIRKDTKGSVPNIKDVRFRRSRGTMGYDVQVQYKEGGRQPPRRTVSR